MSWIISQLFLYAIMVSFYKICHYYAFTSVLVELLVFLVIPYWTVKFIKDIFNSEVSNKHVKIFFNNIFSPLLILLYAILITLCLNYDSDKVLGLTLNAFFIVINFFAILFCYIIPKKEEEEKD